MKQKNSLPAVFLTPAMGILAVLALVPTAYAIYISFQNRELSRPDGSFVGFANYIDLFSDRRFINAIGVSLTWEAVTVGITLAIAVGLGILLFECVSPRTRNLLALLFLVPVILPRVSAAFVWKFAFHPLYGIATYPYKAITGQPLDLLSNPATALATVALVDVWQWGLFFAVIVLKLLETLPPQPFEAARLDHARTWEIYAFIALPMLKAPLISLAFVKMIESLRAFDLIYVMTRGGPGIATETLDMYAFSQGFIESGRISYASSMAVLMMIATSIAFTFIWKRVQ
ncbi:MULTISPECIES: sugar ABC transporter permease [Ensifer]|jgi:multiple sugar transport system permease protein|uniref:carbohydrate ABC transporter permease n=1 Tax=Ensifer TaxID=106591 RepID=UPI000712ED69|nr:MULTISPECIES: sugar ABC transporter permease [Ensifer]KSV73032.1 sugar ABC transporter permease [Sinorhizobium sp. GW3]OWZ95587.1 sugar ABC transporter permease [Sinorhizobium sp. LM21]KQX31831.1 sugar ABC transporter permease [Ensifer sp. Root423]KQZ53960.1 sugar ABC transporter permease [Ensifer sp. Root558]MBD9570712.1 sugar ABC transporter permease [Ensifer sp. ENS08]